MLKIKYLILSLSFLIVVSCNIRIENIQDYKNKYSVEYLSGGQNAFIFKNILTQQLIANNMHDENSKLIIAISMTKDETYLSTSVTKVATRKLQKLSIQIKTYNEINKQCVLFNNKYESEQSFLLASSGANLSNIAADDDIFIINSENISLEVIDDLIINSKNKCEIVE
jgi:hypothetical protein